MVTLGEGELRAKEADAKCSFLVLLLALLVEVVGSLDDGLVGVELVELGEN